jgi:PKD repeat protein
MKKTVLITAALALLSAGVMAQGTNKQGVSKKRNFSASELKTTSNNNGGTKYNRCGTVKPSETWDAEFNKQVEAYKLAHAADIANGKVAATSYTIPIIYHVIHGGQAVGTYPNIAAGQINSQTTVLNADYGATGAGVSTYTALSSGGHGPFYDYANGNSLPAPDNTTAGVKVANCGITFCMATKDPSGNTLTEPGIDRVNYTTKGWANPNSTAYNSTSTFQSYIDGTIKPGTIWDPTKYFNVWLTDENTSVGLLGYSTFPASSGNTGLSAPYGTTTTDGCWFWTKVCGSKTIYPSGTYDATYYLGRTITHESGHYLGLRHTWGDGACVTDYCNDTPPEGAATYYGSGTGNSSWVYPYTASNTCSGSGAYNSDLGDGIMYMNFMDYSDDAYMCMFTNDQAIRMQTSLANSPMRKGPAQNAAAVCAGVTAVAPVAGFTYPGTICTGQPYTFTDASTNSPTSYTWTANPSTGVVITSTNSASPAISFSTTGTYTITQTVANTAGSNSASHTITSTTCVPTCDTMRNVIAADLPTPHIYWADAVAPRDSGYALGTNAYKDKAKAEKYTYANNGKQIKAIQVYIHKAGTGNVTFNVWNDNATPGTPGTVLASKTVGLGTLVNNGYNTITLTSPVTPGSVFYVGFNIPTTTGDTIAVASNDGTNGVANMGFEQWSDNTWNAYSGATVYNTNLNNFMFPIMCPAGGTTGIEHNELGNAINLFPNPNNGQFNFSVNLPEASNLNFTIVNMIGQVVYTKSENNITNAVLSCDLSHLAKGVYYANITDGKNNKTVKKIIIE